MNEVLEHFNCDISHFDAHIHTPWIQNFEDFKSSGLKTFGVSVTPQEYKNSDCLALGMHPWYADIEQLELFRTLAEKTSYIGEIGLDFVNGKDSQLEVFEAVCQSIKPQSYVSIHSVKAMSSTFEILKSTGRLDDCCLIFHWYSEDGEILTRLRRAGCYFSINPKMLETKRGREYTRQVEMDKLLIETDLPKRQGSKIRTGDIFQILNNTYNQIREIKGL